VEVVSQVLTKGWEAGAEDGKGITLQNGEWSPEMKLYGCNG